MMTWRLPRSLLDVLGRPVVAHVPRQEIVERRLGEATAEFGSVEGEKEFAGGPRGVRRCWAVNRCSSAWTRSGASRSRAHAFLLGRALLIAALAFRRTSPGEVPDDRTEGPPEEKTDGDERGGSGEWLDLPGVRCERRQDSEDQKSADNIESGQSPLLRPVRTSRWSLTRNRPPCQMTRYASNPPYQMSGRMGKDK